MKIRIALAIFIVLAFAAVGYAVYLNSQIFWWKDSLAIHTKISGMCQARADSGSGIYRLLEKELDPPHVDRFSGRVDGPFEIWGYYYRPKLGEYERVAVEGYIEGYNTMMRKEYKRLEAKKIKKQE